MIYEKSDSIIKKIKATINAEFHNFAIIPGLDELKIISVREKAEKLFARLKKKTHKWFLDLISWAYADGIAEAEEEGFYPEEKSDPKEILKDLLETPNPVSGYAYDAEYERKMNRMIEAIVAAESLQDTIDAVNRSGRVLERQERTYSDLSVDEGRKQSFLDCGVKEVMWVTQRDGRVCEECRSRNGKVYPIASVPPKPHPYCRCYIVPHK